MMNSNKIHLTDKQQKIVDDAVDWYPGTDLRGIFATVFPDGTIKHGFVEIENK